MSSNTHSMGSWMPLSRLAPPLTVLDGCRPPRPDYQNTRRHVAVKHRILGILDDLSSSSLGIRGMLRRVAVEHSHRTGFSDPASPSTYRSPRPFGSCTWRVGRRGGDRNRRRLRIGSLKHIFPGVHRYQQLGSGPSYREQAERVVQHLQDHDAIAEACEWIAALFADMRGQV